ncbi:MAG: hypothetical protein GY913_30180 [Proteobacteria bacterium]|nr:hypothetical protein [Pseudomonadota bacterium]MCP4921186.1 hypothetical protein [Pseudomonadota bacterium]
MIMPTWMVVAVPAMFVALGLLAHNRDRARKRALNAQESMRLLRGIGRVEDARRDGEVVRFKTRTGTGELDLAGSRLQVTLRPGCPHLIWENGELRGRHLGLAQLAFDDNVRHRVAAVGPIRLWVDDDRLHLHTFKAPEDVLAEFLALAEVLPGDAWGELSLALGLPRHGARMRGHIDGVPVSVLATPEGGTEIEATVDAGFHAALEAPFVMQPLGHPILDGLIAVWAVRDRELLDDGRVVEALLDVVHAHPGSEVTDLAIRLVDETFDVAELPARVDKVVHLARVLGG